MEELRWDLTELYPGPESPELEADIERAKKLAQEFEKKYRGRINDPHLSADLLAQALSDYEGIVETAAKLEAYAELLFSLDTQNSAAKALLAKVEEINVSINNQLLFFELEWKQLPEELASKLLADPELSRWHHALEKERLLIPHTLSEPEEKILKEKSVVVSAWQKHFTGIIGRVEVARRPLAQALSELHNPDRKRRRRTQQKVTNVLRAEANCIVDIFNALILDHGIDIRLRNYQDPMALRNLENEVSGTAVEALLTTCDENTDIVARYYRLKRRLLGLGRLYDYDRYAPLFQEGQKFSLSEARDLIVATYSDYSSEMGKIADLFFENSWIDTPVVQGKRGGAFSASLPFLHPFILMNRTGNRSDVETLTHELGHGIHQYLYSPISLLQCDPPLTVAETASVFGEQLVFEQLKRQTEDPKERLALLCTYLDSSFATIFRQAAFTRFEQKLHQARAKEELSIEQINAFWLETQDAMFQGSVTITKNYAWWWVYIHHFIYVPFYCYAYAFGNLLVLALYGKYLKEGEAFIPKYLDLLRAGGSDSPADLLKKVGVDIEDPDFWKEGMEILRETVEEAEELARELGY